MTDLDNLMTRLADLDSKDVGLWNKDDIDTIIAYQRKMRAQREAGVKVSRKKNSDVPEKKIDLLALGLVKRVEPITRRKL